MVVNPPSTHDVPDSAFDTELQQHTPCAFCDQQAERACPHCGLAYCERHGGAYCDRCSDPINGVPSRRLMIGAFVVGGIGLVAAAWLLAAPPKLSGEGAATNAPRTATVPRTAAPAQQPTAAVSATRTPAPATRYKLQQGDTLSVIARNYNTTVEALIAANPGISATSLQVGTEITIPGQ